MFNIEVVKEIQEFESVTGDVFVWAKSLFTGGYRRAPTKRSHRHVQRPVICSKAAATKLPIPLRVFPPRAAYISATTKGNSEECAHNPALISKDAVLLT